MIGASESLQTEALWRLPGVSGTYAPHDTIPAVRALRGQWLRHLRRDEPIGDDALAACAEILRAVPDARLFMVVANIETAAIRAQVEARLTAAGIPPEPG